MIIVLKSLDPDCYKMVYDNRNKDYTTYLPPEKTNDEEDNG